VILLRLYKQKPGTCALTKCKQKFTKAEKQIPVNIKKYCVLWRKAAPTDQPPPPPPLHRNNNILSQAREQGQNKGKTLTVCCANMFSH